MAAFGGIATGASAGASTTLDTANLNVTGSDLALFCGGGDMRDLTASLSFVWDPAGNNESMTGQFAALSPGSYLECEMEYLDDPTAANAPVRMTSSVSSSEMAVIGMFFTAAGAIVGTDTANDSFATTGTSVSATVPNVVSGDLVADMLAISGQDALTVGADQTARESSLDGGPYLRMGASTQAGADGGVMSWTFANQAYGAALIAARIPDAGGAAANPKGPLGMPLHGPFAGPVGP